MLIGFGLTEIRTIWTFKTDLIELKSSLRSADIRVATNKDRQGSEYNTSMLIFYLNGINHKFTLSEHIEKEWRSKEHEKLLSELRRAQFISVWIKKSELDIWEPQVFQIGNHRRILLDVETVRSKSRNNAIWFLILGFLAIAFVLIIPQIKKSY